MKMKYSLLLWVLSINVSIAAEVPEHHVWDKSPIQISLPLNQDRLIHFPKAINIIDSELPDVNIMKVQDAMYLNAHHEFHNKRLIVQLMPKGEAIVLSVSANSDSNDAAPIEIIINEESKYTEDSPIQGFEANPIALTRFAIQSLFSPARLLVTPPNVTRVPMHTFHQIHFMHGASITARPLISWQANGLHVTAIELKNDLNKTLKIDPGQFLGNWQTIALFPSNIVGIGETTTAFVTSALPFHEALMDTQEFVR